MARPKKSNTTAITSEKEVVAETVETKAEEAPVETVKEEKPENKEIADNDEVEIVCMNLAGRSVKGMTEVYSFDENGKATVNGKDAKRFLTIPGYQLA